MSDKPANLAQLFKLDQRKPVGNQAEQEEQLKAMKAKIAEEAKGLPVPPMLYDKLFELLISKLSEVLENIHIGDILAKAWTHALDLQKYCDPEEYPPDETFMVPLVDHEVESEHNPAVELKLKQKLLGVFEFDVGVGLLLQGVVLQVRDGKIIKMSIGSCSGTGSIGYNVIPLFEIPEAEEIPLGTIDLGEGVAIQKAEDSEENVNPPAQATV